MDGLILDLWVFISDEALFGIESLGAGAFTIANDLWNPATQSWNLSARHIFKQQDVWYVMGMTTWIVLPWICTREVPVDIELVSILRVLSSAVTCHGTGLRVPLPLAAIAQGRCCPLQAWDAARSPRTH